MRSFLAEFADPGGIGLGEAVAEFLKLPVADFDIPGGFDGAPTLLKFRAIDFGKMRFGIALHVNDAELYVGIGEQTSGNGQQTAEVVVNDNHDATKAPFNQAAQDKLPIL